MKTPGFILNPRIPFAEVLARLDSLRWGRLVRMGAVSGFPILLWRHAPPRPRASIVLSAGVHGDEPAGVECLLDLLEKRPPWLRPFDLTIFPCLNPWGYERNRRVNARGLDLNRQWRHDSVAESALARRALGDRRFELTICLHEDYDATGFYLYELAATGEARVGEAIVERVARFLPIERRAVIEGRRAQGGVVTRPIESLLRRRHWPEAIFHFMRHTSHTLTTETPTRAEIGGRVRAHAEAIRLALRHKVRLGAMERKA